MILEKNNCQITEIRYNAACLGQSEVFFFYKTQIRPLPNNCRVALSLGWCAVGRSVRTYPFTFKYARVRTIKTSSQLPVTKTMKILLVCASLSLNFVFYPVYLELLWSFSPIFLDLAGLAIGLF